MHDDDNEGILSSTIVGKFCVGCVFFCCNIVKVAFGKKTKVDLYHGWPT